MKTTIEIPFPAWKGWVEAVYFLNNIPLSAMSGDAADLWLGLKIPSGFRRVNMTGQKLTRKVVYWNPGVNIVVQINGSESHFGTDWSLSRLRVTWRRKGWGWNKNIKKLSVDFDCEAIEAAGRSCQAFRSGFAGLEAAVQAAMMDRAVNSAKLHGRKFSWLPKFEPIDPSKMPTPKVEWRREGEDA